MEKKEKTIANLKASAEAAQTKRKSIEIGRAHV